MLNGFFILCPIQIGIRFSTTAAKALQGWVEDPKNDFRNVWSDENPAADLAAGGQKVLYIDAHLGPESRPPPSELQSPKAKVTV